MADTYSKGTRVWFPDKELGWISAEVTAAVKSAAGSLKLTFVDDRGKEIVIDTTVKAAQGGNEQLPPLRNPPLLETCEDLATLSHLNEPSVLHAIQQRYAQHSIYTYSGIVLIAVNPFQRVNLYGPETIQAYTGRKKGELEPHLFAIAEDAHTNMRKDRIGQTIIVSGESGAGKTESAKLIMRFLASVNGSEGDAKPKTKSLEDSSEIERQMLATNPILEAFGNAKTARNDNSSRFGKYLQILFDNKNEIVGARIRTYLLERSRLVYQPETERNYHIFYQLLAGAPAKERKDLGLDDLSKFFYLNQGGPGAVTVDGIDDAEEFRDTQAALSTVGVSVEKQWAVFRLLAALLHLGNIKINAMRNDSSIDDHDTSLVLATRLLGLSPVEFKKWTTKRQINTRNEKIVSSLNAAQATIVRDSVSKFIYACLFEWLISMVNDSLAGEDGQGALLAESFIGVLDIYGFEHYPYKAPSRGGGGPPTIANSFEQFCINYANEKLQQEFNAHVFKLEQEEYVREQINWTFIDFSDNQPCIDVIEGKLGILSLLDEESRLPAGTDASFITKLMNQLATATHKDVFKKPRFGNTAFTIAHYAIDVTYEAEGFIEKNRDTVPDEHLALLASTKNYFFKEVLDAALASVKPPDAVPQSPAVSDSGSTASRRSSVIPDPGRLSFSAASGRAGSPSGGSGTKRGVGPGAIAKKPTLGTIFKNSLASLMDTIGMTNAHYIRCIKPNEQKRAWEFAPQQVLSQLRACGVLETIRISCAGYPSRWTYEEFAERYYMLLHSSKWRLAPDTTTLCNEILRATIPDSDKFQSGLTKIFFRAGMLAALESLRSKRLAELVTLIQKNVKRRLAQQRYQLMRRSAIKIQTWWRGILARRFVLTVRKEAAALRFQCAARAFIQRQRFVSVRRSVIKLQSHIRGSRERARVQAERITRAATLLQSLFRGVLTRRSYRSDVKHVIWMQSCIRRRYARRELKALRAEARSASKFKEISYKLENKVVELTQVLQTRTNEKKELSSRLVELERQLQTWMNKHEEMDNKAKQLQNEIQTAHVPKSQFEELLAAKQGLDARLGESTQKIASQEEEIKNLTAELERQVQEMEQKSKAAAEEMAAAVKAAEKGPSYASLKAELMQLRDQLNRSNALNALTKSAREPTSPGLKTFDTQQNVLITPTSANGFVGRHQRRHSSAAAYGSSQDAAFREAPDVPVGFSRSQNPKAVSIAFNGVDGLRGFRPNGLGRIFDDPAEERVKLLDDAQHLDEDVLDGLIRGLKIPTLNLSNPPSIKEVLFPANLIALVTNEMWKFGLIPESERFLANVMQTIQAHVMSFNREDAIMPGIFWLSNVHELLSFICMAENDMLQGIGPGGEVHGREFDWADYERLVSIVKHDLDSLEYNIYHTWMLETKRQLSKMVIPALIESQSLPGFTTNDGGGRLFGLWRALKCFFVEESVVQQVVVELLRLIGVTSFNDLLMRRNFCSWKRAMQIQYNITRIEEWCKSHDMPEGTLQLEHLMQATKLLQLKKSSSADIQIIYDVCWILTPLQIQRMCSNYYVADYEHPISPEILKVVASRVIPNDKTDHLLLSPETEDVGPYEIPLPREIAGLETYVPAYLNVPHIRRLASLVE
ncbi:myosin 5 [Cantharellus anzutake]|uniref:myosin 5 n=1 Tax=Cantharellus anzutake TaxID=1750568 RepID=UPI00190368D7|nr:myosin 5 [Cantharellus anzutake]KAF8334031.1 myosin 5 [Cantharellus anzutake]